MNKLEKENEYLKERIRFLELIIDVNQETITKAINTNSKLISWLKENGSQLSEVVNSKASSTS